MKPLIFILAIALLTVNCYALPCRSIELYSNSFDDFLVNWLDTTVKNTRVTNLNTNIYDIEVNRSPIEVKNENVEEEYRLNRTYITSRSSTTTNNVYQIKKGDTLWAISKRYNTTVKELSNLNPNLDPNKLVIGSKILLPYLSFSELSFKWPVIGQITSPFGMRNNDFHRGLDIGAKSLTKITASAAGVVIEAGWHTYYGKYILIDHGDGYKTRYAHSSKLLVSKGKWVDSGEVIALVGSTGKSTGPHLHFEIIKDDVHQNPMKYLP